MSKVNRVHKETAMLILTRDELELLIGGLARLPGMQPGAVALRNRCRYALKSLPESKPWESPHADKCGYCLGSPVEHVCSCARPR